MRKSREKKLSVKCPFLHVRTLAPLIIARLSFTRLLVGACWLVLLRVCFVEAQAANLELKCALGEGYRRRDEGRYDSAEAAFQDVIAYDPKNRTDMEELVWEEFSSPRYAEAGRAGDN